MAEEQSKTMTTLDVDRYIGKQLRSYRLKRSIRRSHLATSLDVTIDEYQKIEDGQMRLSASDLFTLKRMYDIPLSYFFSEEGEYFSDIIVDGSEMADIFHYFSNIENPKVRQHFLKQIKLASNVF